MHTDKLKYKELTHHIIKGFFEVYTDAQLFESDYYWGGIAHEFWKWVNV